MLGRVLIFWFLLPQCNALGNHQELEKGERLLKDKLRANKMKLGKWVWYEASPWPSWDAIAKAPIWSADEWESVGVVIGKPLAQPKVITFA